MCAVCRHPRIHKLNARKYCGITIWFGIIYTMLIYVGWRQRNKFTHCSFPCAVFVSWNVVDFFGFCIWWFLFWFVCYHHATLIFCRSFRLLFSKKKKTNKLNLFRFVGNVHVLWTLCANHWIGSRMTRQNAKHHKILVLLMHINYAMMMKMLFLLISHQHMFPKRSATFEFGSHSRKYCSRFS